MILINLDLFRSRDLGFGVDVYNFSDIIRFCVKYMYLQVNSRHFHGLDSNKKDAQRNFMQNGGTKTSRSLFSTSFRPVELFGPFWVSCPKDAVDGIN